MGDWLDGYAASTAPSAGAAASCTRRAATDAAWHPAARPLPPLAGTAGLNVPMFIALRRFTLLFTILLERYWLKKSHDWPTLSAMMIMIGGALMAAATDLSFNPRGYAAVLCNDLLTSLYLIMVKNTPVSNGLRWVLLVLLVLLVPTREGWWAVGREQWAWGRQSTAALSAVIPAAFPPADRGSLAPFSPPALQHHGHAVLQLRAVPAHAAGGGGDEGGAPGHGELPPPLQPPVPDGAAAGLSPGPHHQPLHLCVHPRQRASHDLGGRWVRPAAHGLLGEGQMMRGGCCSSGERGSRTTQPPPVACPPCLTPCVAPFCPCPLAPAGNLKNAIMTIVGAFAFGDFIFEYWNAAGLAVSFAGAVWYAMRSALRVSGRCHLHALLELLVGRRRVSATISARPWNAQALDTGWCPTMPARRPHP